MANSVGERVRERMRVDRPGLPQATLAAEVGMKPDAFSRALNGLRAFSADELVRLANVLHTSMHWLATGDDDPYAVAVAARHVYDPDARTHVAERWMERRANIQDVALVYQQLDAIGWTESPAYKGVPLSASEARHQLEHAWPGAWVRNLALAVESAFGVDVIRVPTERGFALQTGTHRAIVADETGNWFFQNWVIAHELGHFAHGDMQDVCAIDNAASSHEAAANAYAADLLLPRSTLEAVNWLAPDPDVVAQMVWTLGVSTDALARRIASLRLPHTLASLSLLQQSTQRFLRRHASGEVRASITKRMEDASTRRFPTWLLEAHATLVDSGRAHAGTLAWMLGVDQSDLDDSLSPSLDIDPDWLDGELGSPSGD